jgi:hypothetical protein
VTARRDGYSHVGNGFRDPVFDRTLDLFERGYLDNVAFVELLEFIREDFGVEVPEEIRVSDDFMRVGGMARIVSCLAGWA